MNVFLLGLVTVASATKFHQVCVFIAQLLIRTTPPSHPYLYDEHCVHQHILLFLHSPSNLTSIQSINTNTTLKHTHTHTRTHAYPHIYVDEWCIPDGKLQRCQGRAPRRRLFWYIAVVFLGYFFSSFMRNHLYTHTHFQRTSLARSLPSLFILHVCRTRIRRVHYAVCFRELGCANVSRNKTLRDHL